MKDTPYNILQRVRGSIHPIRKGVPDDIFLAAASFEARSTAGANLFDPQAFDHALIFRYADTLDSNAGYEYSKLLSKTINKKRNKSSKVILCNYEQPLDVINCIDSWIPDISISSTQLYITIDITCFTKLHLILLFDYIGRKLSGSVIRIVYSEPLTYADSVGKALSYGIKDTVYFPIHSGRSEGKKAALIAFLGHENSRVEHIIDELEPDETILILARSGYTPDMVRTSESKNAFLLRQVNISSRFKLAQCSARDFRSVVQLLQSIVGHLLDEHFDTFFIAPLGTKLEAIGVSLFLGINENLRQVIAYSIPKRYEKSAYSMGIGRVWQALVDSSEKIETSQLIEVSGNYYTNPFEIPVKFSTKISGSARIKILHAIKEMRHLGLGKEFANKDISTILVCDGYLNEQKFGGSSFTEEEVLRIQEDRGKICFQITREDLGLVL